MTETTHYTAAGGVLTSADGAQVLLLIRPAVDEVRLPKGHVEPGETCQAAAVREVAEETGYADAEVLADLGEQLVVFTTSERIVQRNEHYYLMRPRSWETVPRPAADALQFIHIWVDWKEAEQNITFEAEREWLHRAQKALRSRL